jgi:hypothetical protein
MSINLGSFLPSTREAWSPIRLEFFNNDGSWMEPEDAAWLLVLLKMSPDTEQLFPHGKWASIQYLEGLVEAEACMALECAAFNRPQVGAITKGL